MSVNRLGHPLIKTIFLLGTLLMTAACSGPREFKDLPTISSVELDPDRQALAVREVRALQAKGQRVWCVPYARNLSGVQIRGNAHTWWSQAAASYQRGKTPAIGAVMVFSKTRSNPNGHIAVVSEVVSDREIRVDHANWKRNKISTGMSIIDVSKSGDWSAVKVESNPGAYGRVYPISGFIYSPSSAAI
ncbi:MAG: CHAP domain-containing protein [Sulfitobacter sp.]